MRQLLPVVLDEIDPAEAYADLPDGVRLNMIASVDGATSVEGLSGALGGPPDRRVFAALRSLADVILVAAGTMRAEGYGPARLPADVQDARRRRGQAPVPPIAVVSRACALDWESPFFAEATARPLVVTVEGAPAENRRRAASVADVLVAGSGDVDLAAAIGALRRRGFRSVLAEGGPSLNGQLAAAGLLDELCLTVSPTIVGGDSRRILTGPFLAAPVRMRLWSVGEDGGFLFLRYRP